MTHESTRSDRIAFLTTRVNALAAEIESDAAEQAFIEYLARVRSGEVAPTPLDEREYDLLLPAEKKARRFEHYHTLRTELLELQVERDNHTTKAAREGWLSGRAVQVVTTAAALAKAATFIIDFIHSHGLFLRDPRAEEAQRNDE